MREQVLRTCFNANASRSRATPALRCPFCDSDDVEIVAPWGGQIITSQWRCGACGSYFEALREDFADAPAGAAATGDDAPRTA